MVKFLIPSVVFVMVTTVVGPHPMLWAQGPTTSVAPGSNMPGDPLWAHVMQQFDEWAAVQQIYTPDQARQWRASIVGKQASLPAAEGKRFAQDLSAKLQVLLGAEARDARKWLADTLAVASDSYARQVKAGLPDPRTMTAPQMQARLDDFEARETNIKQVESSLQQTRQMQVRAAEANERAQEAANAAAWQGGGNLYGSAYHPASNQNQHIYRRYIPPAGRSIGFGYGFYW